MKIKISELLKTPNSLSRLAQADLGAKGLYWTSKDLEVILKELERIDKVRQKLLDDTTQKDEKGRIAIDEKTKGVVFLTSEDDKKFTDEWNAFLETEVELEIKPIPLKFLFGRTFRLTPGDLVILKFMIVEPSEAELEELEVLK